MLVELHKKVAEAIIWNEELVLSELDTVSPRCGTSGNAADMLFRGLGRLGTGVDVRR